MFSVGKQTVVKQTSRFKDLLFDIDLVSCHMWVLWCGAADPNFPSSGALCGQAFVPHYSIGLYPRIQNLAKLLLARDSNPAPRKKSLDGGEP